MAATQTKPVGNPRNFIQGTVTATNDAIALLGFLSHGSVSILLSGTWTGTITFYATNDGGTTWTALNLLPAASATPASTATSNGLWGDVIHGWNGVKAGFSTASSGTPTITIQFQPSQF